MKGYLSSLIRQTGIVLGAGGAFHSESFGSPSVRPEELQKTTPVHAGEEKADEVPLTKPVGEIRADATEVFVHPDTHTKSMNTRYKEKVLSENLTDKVAGEYREYMKTGFHNVKLNGETGEKQHPAEEGFRGMTLHIAEGFTTEEENPRKIFEKDIPSASEIPSSDCDNNYGNMFEKKTADEIVGQEYLSDLSSKHGMGLNDQLTGQQILKSAFHEVRQWITEAPVNDRGEGKKSGASKNIDAKSAENKTPFFTGQDQLPVISEQGYTGQKETEKPEVHDFHLSIGTISLTVEGPQMEIQSYKPAQTERGAKPVRENSSSRLIRHYIRI
ncbi:MAG: hypothetical protein ACUBOA_10510 [Candidatus Loosdrechtia sp.]|uniref:hypothetical protein n=1 Tax=Candidatus Loosdrechtia sp. TaxID=3101272 RepID=UPI003A6D6CF6|nr:MAG: hypothetical protein QY305_05940 [Candidatus Jettenia sp. AMX2]